MLADVVQLPARLGAVLLVVDTLIRVAALVFVPRGRLPSAGLAWLLAIFFLPVVGGIAYLVLGRSELPRARRDAQAATNERLGRGGDGVDELVVHAPHPEWIRPVTRMMQRVGATPLLGGSRGELVLGFEEQVRRLVEAVDGARRVVHVEFYTLSRDDSTAPFFDALARATARGVEVRVLADHLGSVRYPRWRATARALDDAGATWHLMVPFQPFRGRWQRPDLRNHRKIVVVDHEVAFAGSMNLIDPSYLKRANRRKGLRWVDSLVRVEGPAVAAVEAVFATDWLSEAGEPPPLGEAPPAPCGGTAVQVVPSGPGFDRQSVPRLVTALAHGAERRLVITTPYFIPDEALLHALTSASLRGVEVELHTGEIADQALVEKAERSYYEALLDAGVRIWLSPRPTIVHAKHMTVDDEVTVVGSANMDIRSFQLDLELMLMVCGRSFVDQLRAVEDGYRRVSRELTAQEWSRRSGYHRVVDDLTRLTSAVQ